MTEGMRSLPELLWDFRLGPHRLILFQTDRGLTGDDELNVPMIDEVDF